MNTEFLINLIKKYQQPDIHIYITGSNARIIASTDESRIGSFGNTAHYILTIQHAASIQDTTPLYNSPSHYGIPIRVNGLIRYIIVVYGNGEKTVSIGDTLFAAIQTSLDYEEFKEKKINKVTDELEQIAEMMLNPLSDKEKLHALMQHNRLDYRLLRYVIIININAYKNEQLRSDVGYEAFNKALKKNIQSQIKKSKHFHRQDLFYSPDLNSVLVIKNISLSENEDEIYRTMGIICEDFNRILKSIEALEFSIVYGNYYEELSQLYKSWIEAAEILELSKHANADEVHNLDHVLLEYIAIHLQPQIHKKYTQLATKKLMQENGQVLQHLIDAAEAFVDSGLNMTVASYKSAVHRNTIATYLKQFTAITGLNPTASFQDAFLTKILAVEIRRIGYYKTTQKTK